MNNDELWIQKQRTYNTWLWGIVALIVSSVVASGVFVYLGYQIGGKTGAYVAATILVVMIVFTAAVLLVRMIVSLISNTTINVSRNTALAIMAHQANDDRGEIMRAMMQSRNADNQTALYINRQANKMADERIKALKNNTMIPHQDDVMAQFDMQDIEE